MKEAIFKRIQKAVEEEATNPIDLNLLDKLRELSAEESSYFSWSTEERNAINIWFEEVKALLLQEVFAGSYSVNILLDCFLVLCFEVGFRLKGEKMNLNRRDES